MVDKLRVGVVVYQESVPTEGGGHSYYSTLLQGINEFEFDPGIEIINIVFSNTGKNSLNLKKRSIFIKGKSLYRKELKQKVKRIISVANLSAYFSKANHLVRFFIDIKQEAQKRKIEKFLRAHKIDLVYYLKPELNVLDYPFIGTHWDVAHKSMPAFPEVSLNNNYKVREDYYLYTLNKAFLILCESETGAYELKKLYSFMEQKIKVVPMFASNVIRENVTEREQLEILEKYGIEKDQFFIYPAQFWACKNHYHLILAFHQLISNTNQPKLKLLLPGSDKGNMSHIRQVITSLSLTDSVIIPGFVSNRELYTFYKNAIALTMTTFLGPTNIPLIEAAHLKCAVICSDMEGHREMLEDNAIYCNPADANSITEAMLRVLDEKSREPLVDSASSHITQSKFNIEKSLRTLNEILIKNSSIRKSWGISYTHEEN